MRYTAFAAIATGVNVATQYVSNSLYTGSFELLVAMVMGTATGLLTKYLLDKRYIFFDLDNSLRGHSVKFTLYSILGVAVHHVVELPGQQVRPPDEVVLVVVALAVGARDHPRSWNDDGRRDEQGQQDGAIEAHRPHCDRRPDTMECPLWRATHP